MTDKSVLTVGDLDLNDISSFLGKYHLTLQLLEEQESITASFWGDSEAGLKNNTLFARKDTPIHSVLHESCHYICMDNDRRKKLNTNAGGTYDEENAVCYLQVLLANDLTGMTSKRMMQDMDTWGYTFRLGSTHAWFEKDAEDALAWLQNHQLLDSKNKPSYKLRN